MASDTEIANEALGHLGVAKEIQNLTTERSAEAQACRRYYQPTLEETLRDFPWPFAGRSLALALVEEAPTTEWAYSYRYPVDCMMFRKILSGIRTDTPETRVPYRVMSDVSGRLIYTDQPSAVGEYTAKITDPSLFPTDFSTAFSMLLAVKIAPRVTGGDPFKMGEAAANKYVLFISKAEKNALNEEQPDRTPESEFIRVRGGSSGSQRTFLGNAITDFPAED